MQQLHDSVALPQLVYNSELTFMAFHHLQKVLSFI